MILVGCLYEKPLEMLFVKFVKPVVVLESSTYGAQP